MQNAPEIIGLGYCGLDYLSIVPEIPFDDKVEIIESLIQGGGPAATAIYTAQRLGAQTAFIGAVGDDERGNMIISELETEGIDCNYIKRQCDKVSPAAFCWVEQLSGKRSIAWTRGSVEQLTEDDLPNKIIAEAKILHLDGHHTKAAIAATKIARSNDVKVILDAGTVLPGIEQIIDNCNVIIVSEKFAHAYTGEANIENALKKLRCHNNEWVIITRGTNGSIAFNGKQIVECPAYEVDVVDTTGAGDVFHGAFIYTYLSCDDIPEAMRFASAAAALKCTKFGGRTGIPDLATVNNFLEQSWTSI